MTKENQELCTSLVKRTWILEKALEHLSATEAEEFETRYVDIQTTYANHPTLKFLSTNYQLDKLEDFMEWLPQLKASKDKITPLLVAKMFHGDPLAISIYGILYKVDNPSLILTYEEIVANETLLEQFSENGLGADSYAILNANHWLNSMAQTTLCSGNQACIEEYQHLFC